MIVIEHNFVPEQVNNAEQSGLHGKSNNQKYQLATVTVNCWYAVK